MTINPQHTLMLMHALSMAARVAGQRVGVEANRQEMQLAFHRLEHERGMFESKADLMRSLISALVERRIDAVKDGFNEVMALYAEQSRHYMAQQATITDAEITTTDALQSARFRKRLGEIDIELRSIRLAAEQLYTQMNEVILRLDGSALALNPDHSAALGLVSHRGH